MKITSLSLILFLVASLGCSADEVVLKEIADNQSSLSPNKRLLATFAGVIKIMDESGGKTFDPVPVLTPIFCLAWSKDSNSLLVVEHIAGGSILSVLQMANGKWTKHGIDPPPDGDFDSYKVTGLELGADSVLVTYLTSNRSNGETLCQQITFDLNLKDLSAAHVKKKTITPGQYGKLNARY